MESHDFLKDWDAARHSICTGTADSFDKVSLRLFCPCKLIVAYTLRTEKVSSLAICRKIGSVETLKRLSYMQK